MENFFSLRIGFDKSIFFSMFFLFALASARSDSYKKFLCPICTELIGQAMDSVGSFKNSSSIPKFCKKLNQGQSCVRTIQRLMETLPREIEPYDFCVALKSCRPKAEALSLKPRPVPTATLHESLDNCQYCVVLFDYLTGEGIQDTTIPVFRELINVVCGELPTASALCAQVNDHHIDTLIKLIAAKFENTELCTVAGFCQ